MENLFSLNRTAGTAVMLNEEQKEKFLLDFVRLFLIVF
jgi:hypothetical protein